MTTRRKIGLVLSVIGLILAFGLILLDMHDAYHTWHAGLDGKDRVFDSWFAYFLSGHKFACVFYLATGGLLFIPGCFLLFAPKSKTLFAPDALQSTPYKRNNRENI